jgi:hypothetical protein
MGAAVSVADIKVEISNKVKELQCPFVDSNFQADDRSLGSLKASVVDGVIWVRASQLGSKVLFSNDVQVQPSDVIEGSLSDCYFVAALSSICLRFDYLKSLFVNYDPSNGFAII